MDENIRFEGVLTYEGAPKELQGYLQKLKGTGVKVGPLPGVPYAAPVGWEPGGPIWPIPFPGIPIPFPIRRVIEEKGFMEGFIKSHNPPPIIRIEVFPDIRGGIRDFHVHLGNEVFVMGAQTFEILVRKAADELYERGQGNTIAW
jgi:hypothetical protein